MPSNVCPQFARGGAPAGTRLFFGIDARLIRLGRIDSLQTDSSDGYVDCIAVDHLGVADYCCLGPGIPMLEGVDVEQACQQNVIDRRTFRVVDFSQSQ